MLFKKSFLFSSVVLCAAFFSLAFTRCSDPTDPAPSFVETTDDTIVNDAKTLGLVGESVDSSDAKIATVEIIEDKGKIKITSKAAGKVDISVYDTSKNKATIKVMVTSTGQIVIGEITQYVQHKAIKITGLTANKTIFLVLLASKDFNADAEVIGQGKTYANGIAQMPLFDKSGKGWDGTGSYYVGIKIDDKFMVSKEKISFTLSETTVVYSASSFEELKINTKLGSLTIKNIPDSYAHILVTGLNGSTVFTGATLTGGSIAINGGVATLDLLATNDETLIDFPMTGEYDIMVYADTKPFSMAGEEPPAIEKLFVGSVGFTNQTATVDWAELFEVPLSGE
jgi:hypothetical protein